MDLTTTRMVFSRDYEYVPGVNGPACAADQPRVIAYFRRQSAEQLRLNPRAVLVRVLNRVSDSRVRYRVESNDEIIIVPSTHGRYGKSRIIRKGASV